MRKDIPLITLKSHKSIRNAFDEGKYSMSGESGSYQKGCCRAAHWAFCRAFSSQVPYCLDWYWLGGRSEADDFSHLCMNKTHL